MDFFPVPRLTFGSRSYCSEFHCMHRNGKKETRYLSGLTAFDILLQSVLFKGRLGLE
jgi:hypothetical protein